MLAKKSVKAAQPKKQGNKTKKLEILSFLAHLLFSFILYPALYYILKSAEWVQPVSLYESVRCTGLVCVCCGGILYLFSLGIAGAVYVLKGKPTWTNQGIWLGISQRISVLGENNPQKFASQCCIQSVLVCVVGVLFATGASAVGFLLDWFDALALYVLRIACVWLFLLPILIVLIIRIVQEVRFLQISALPVEFVAVAGILFVLIVGSFPGKL